MGWQALSMLQLCVKDKTKRHTNKTKSNDPAKSKKNLKPFVAVNCYSGTEIESFSQSTTETMSPHLGHIVFPEPRTFLRSISNGE